MFSLYFKAYKLELWEWFNSFPIHKHLVIDKFVGFDIEIF